MSRPTRMVLGVCTFNRGERIVRTLEAISAMDRVGGRVAGLMVIDNNSTDSTGSIVDAFAGACERLPVRRVLETRQGQGFARERLVRDSSEEIIAFLDDDVLPEPGWAAAILSVFDDRPTAAMAGGRVVLEWEGGPTPAARRDAALLAQQDLGSRVCLVDGPMQSLVGAACAIRRSHLDACGWLTRRIMGGRAGGALTSGDDYELGLRLRRVGGELWYTPAAVCSHLIPPERQTPEYLDRLARGVSRAEAFLKWIEAGEPAESWIAEMRVRAERKLRRTQWLEWRPGRRRRRLLERQARLDGWNELLAFVRQVR